MYKLFPLLFTVLTVFTALTPRTPYTGVPAPAESMNGTIIADYVDTIEILPAKDKSKTIVLKVLPETYIVDAVSGKPASLSARLGDATVAYYTVESGENKAVALIIDIPEDYSPPVYAKAALVSQSGDLLYVLTDRGVIVTIAAGTPIESFLTRTDAAIENITENTDLLLWNQAYNMSIPARTAANRVVILGNGDE